MLMRADFGASNQMEYVRPFDEASLLVSYGDLKWKRCTLIYLDRCLLCVCRVQCMPPLVPGDPSLSSLDTAYGALCNLETSKSTQTCCIVIGIITKHSCAAAENTSSLIDNLYQHMQILLDHLSFA